MNLTGEQLSKFIDMLDEMLHDFEENSPELESELILKRHKLTLLEKISEEERKNNFHTKMDKSISSYALSTINQILINDQETRHLDYSPMYGLLARYGIKLSNVCDYLGISTNARTSISKNESVHLDILIQIADFLECEPNDLYTFIDSSEKTKREMKESLVKESQRVLIKEKDVPIPTAIIREIRETDKVAKTELPFNQLWVNDNLLIDYSIKKENLDDTNGWGRINSELYQHISFPDWSISEKNESFKKYQAYFNKYINKLAETKRTEQETTDKEE